MAVSPHRIDKNGARFRVGDIVRIVGVPDLSGMSKRALRESLPIFQYLVGKYKRVVGFDRLGSEFVFRILDGRNKGTHAVSIEPALLRVRKKRSGGSFEKGRAK